MPDAAKRLSCANLSVTKDDPPFSPFPPWVLLFVVAPLLSPHFPFSICPFPTNLIHNAFAFVPSAPPRLSSYVHNPRRRLRRRYAPTIAYASPATTTPLQIFPHAYRAHRLHRHRPHEFISSQRSRSEFSAASPPSSTPAFSPSSSAFRRLRTSAMLYNSTVAGRKLRCVVVILPFLFASPPPAHTSLTTLLPIWSAFECTPYRAGFPLCRGCAPFALPPHPKHGFIFPRCTAVFLREFLGELRG
ncbi:hypothetical protein B0H19DRAFT_161251 [Mycena capillaripes]|nr:hypothetical protein B0H19DRAFT_161251 [Mycena capillaripes]